MNPTLLRALLYMGTYRRAAGSQESALAESDRLVLELLAAHRFALLPQVARLIGGSERSTGTRLRALERRGLVESEAIFRRRPPAAWITRGGLRALGAGPRPAGPRAEDLRHYRHEVGVVWLWLAARDGAFGAPTAVVAEREMRAHDGRAAPSTTAFGVGVGGFDWRGRRTRHYPDLLVSTVEGERLAIELELTRKSDPRLARIMRGYAGDPRIDRVLYIVENDALAGVVARAARLAGIEPSLRVHRLSAADIPGAPSGRAHSAPPGRARGASARPLQASPRREPRR